MQQTNKPYTFRWARELSVSSLTYEKENATILGTAESLGLYKRNLDWTWHVNRTEAADALFKHLLYVAGISEDELQAMPVMDRAICSVSCISGILEPTIYQSFFASLVDRSAERPGH